ncbi:hypothetical protein SAMN05444695_101527 [Rhodococcus triatomae]|uniref:ATP-binding protein n=1 Tax=Rhodococcus triatomae TaxID=300028 RepID=A0A1G8AST1_9NOCA|nr:hypothetical protein SAMN05444695_101527 [Rhodococcus triatomae]
MRSGYRDRLLTELAQNAADTAARAGVPGFLDVRVDGDLLSVANSGAPLDEQGVQALSALRASGKREGVGRFGVGFTAVRSVGDEVEVRSSTGSIEFSAERTGRALTAAGLPVPEDGVPVLRLAWPSAPAPRAGFATEVVIRLRADIDADRLLDAMAEEATDLLLELPALHAITVGDTVVERAERALDSGLVEVRIGSRTWWRYDTEHARWFVPVRDGIVRPVGEDVLRAPTRSDEQLSLPALVIGDVAMQPDRRRVLPGAPVQRLARGYAGLVAAVPAAQRTALVPAPTFARSEVDGLLREALLAELRDAQWLPVVPDPSVGGVAVVAPPRAHLVPGLDDALAAALSDVVGDLVIPDLSSPRHQQALAAVDVHRIGPARIAELLAGVRREPSWWRALYAALEPLVVDSVVAEELSAIPVPLCDGSTVTGPRTVLLGTGMDAGPVVDWARVVHPEAAHPLLARLGAAAATPVDLLSDPALLARIEELEDGDFEDGHPGGDEIESSGTATELAATVLSLANGAAPGTLPSWLGRLPIPDADGELRPADELLLPDAPLADVLDEDSPFGCVDAAFAERVGERALRAVGVGAGFTVLRVELPSGPDHDLDDEQAWWGSLGEDPEVLEAVRDLDLVDPARWRQALTLLAQDPSTRPLLADPHGYTAWWLRRHAVLDGVAWGTLRAPEDRVFAGLLDIADHPDAEVLRATLAPARVDSAEFADLLLQRLADATRSPAPGVVTRAHRLLGEAARHGVLDLDDIDLPPGVRTLDGTVADPDDAMVLDRPWLAAVVPPSRLVVGTPDTADALADLLDLPTAGSVVHGVVIGTGRVTRWADEPGAVLAAALAGTDVPDGPVTVHERLAVRVGGAVDGEVDVPWWVDEDGTTHCTTEWRWPVAASEAARRR